MNTTTHPDLRVAATAALAMCERIIEQYPGVKYGVDFRALKGSLEAALAAKSVGSAEALDHLNWIDDFIARCNGDDRGACESVNVLRRAFAEKSEPTQAARDVLAERRRQVEIKGWTPQHDDEEEHSGQLAFAGAAYAQAAGYAIDAEDMSGTYIGPPDFWPWMHVAWKPGRPRRMLVKAAALLLAQIEAIDRDPATSADNSDLRELLEHATAAASGGSTAPVHLSTCSSLDDTMPRHPACDCGAT